VAVEQHPAASDEARTRAGRLRAELSGALGPQPLAAIAERARATPLDALVVGVLETAR
jgi:hypothetical protein